MHEVSVKLPGVMEVCCRCCIWRVLKGRSDIIMVEIKFGAQQTIFMRKSVVGTWYAIGN